MKACWTSIILLLTFGLFGVLVTDKPVVLTQPNQSSVHVLLSGDEYFNYYHDEAGYKIIKGADGYYYYAQRSGEQFIASKYRVNSVDPVSVGLQKDIGLTREEYMAKRNARFRQMNNRSTREFGSYVNNLVIFIRFADQTEFTTPRSAYDASLNSTAPEASSLRDYFLEASYNQCEIVSHFYPESALTINISYQDIYPRSHYIAQSASNPNGYTDQMEAEQSMLIRAIDSVRSQIPPDIDLDSNNDGEIDNLCFVIRGGNEGWAELLWAHSWNMMLQDVYINNKHVNRYTFQPESQVDVYTLCHEMFHAIGAPDLYHYNSNPPVACGNWDLMDSNFVHMSAYMKYRYGRWIPEIPEISGNGVYSLSPLTSATNNCYKIRPTNSINDFIVVEFRKNTPGTYEENIPGSGLVFTKINEVFSGQGNAAGPPDEVYIYRPNGTSTQTGNLNQAYFSVEARKTVFSATSNPSPFLSNGNPADILFNQISSSNADSMTFMLNPREGILEGIITSDEQTVDLSQARIQIGQDYITCDEMGFFQTSMYEGHYHIFVSLPHHTSYEQDIDILPLHSVFVEANLQVLPVPQALTYSVAANYNVRLDWALVSGEITPDSYSVYMSLNGGSFSVFRTTTEATITFPFTHPLDLDFYITAVVGSQESLPSNSVHIDYVPVEEVLQKPLVTSLTKNYPNPFNPSTSFTYSLEKDADVKIDIYNVKGQKIKNLVAAKKIKGIHKVVWNGRDEQNGVCSSGVYFIKMSVLGKTFANKMLMLK